MMWHKIILMLILLFMPSGQLHAKVFDNAIKRDPFLNKRKNLNFQYYSLKLDHLDGEEAIKLLTRNDMLSAAGKAFFNKQSSMLILYDTQSYFTPIVKLLRKLDKRPQQVEITAHIVTTSDEFLSNLGVNWEYQCHLSQGIKSIDTGLTVTSPTIRIGMTILSFAGNLLNLQLAAFEAENQVEIIASPRLLTTHLMPASIRQGTEIPYEVNAGKHGTATIEFKQAVLGLEVTPRVLQDNYLELNLRISQNSVGQAIKRSEGGESLTIDTEEVKTQVIVKQGQTLMLGGIFQQNRNNGSRQIPILSTLPFIGSLFQQKHKKNVRKELIIFITPKIITEVGSAS